MSHKPSDALAWTLALSNTRARRVMAYHRGNEVPGLLGLTGGWSRVMLLLVGRE